MDATRDLSEPKPSTESHTLSHDTSTTAYMGSTNQVHTESIDSEKENDAARVSSDALGSVQQLPNLANESDKDEFVRASHFENTNYPTGMRLATVTLALILAVFCVALDNTIIATAIPHISDAFKNLNDVGWYGSAYLLTTCAFQLFYGKLYTYFNIKWVFIIALLIFEAGSLLCGVAPTSNAFIIGRAIAGVGSAGLFSGALIIIAYLVPLERRPIFTGVIGGIYGIASVVGPLMGGAFTDNLTWRWCFYINLPLGGLTLLIIMLFFHPAPRKANTLTWLQTINNFDLPGTIVFVPAIICLLTALQFGGTQWAWSDGRIITLFVVFGVLLIVFIAIQFWQGDIATVPIRIASQRSIAFGSLFAFCIGSCFFLFVYYMPIWFQSIKDDSATRSGIDVLPLILGQAVGAIIAGGGTTRSGYYMPFIVASCVFMPIGAGLLTTLKVNSPAHKWIGYQVIYGIGSGFGFQQSTIAAQTVLAANDIPIGVSICMFVQLFGGSLFVSVGENVFSNHLVSNIASAHIPGLDPQIIVKTGATELRQIVAKQYVPAVLEAYNSALVKTFQVGLIMSCLAIFGMLGMQWKSVKGKTIEMAA